MAPIHALIIDDQSLNVTVLANLLTKEGVTHTDLLDPLQVTDTLNGLSALDIVFLDLEMPGANGYDVLKILQADPRFNNVPVVAYTVHVSELNTAYHLGFHSLLAKPIDPDLFPAQLASILGGEHVWRRN